MHSEHDYHYAVLWEETLDVLMSQPKGIYIDATCGGGGHSKGVLSRLQEGCLYAFDQDIASQQVMEKYWLNTVKKETVKQEEQEMTTKKDMFKFILSNFTHMQQALQQQGVSPGSVQGILADLGVSSHQIDQGSRGFSIRYEGELDMRMNTAAGLTGAQVLNTYPEKALARLFKEYADLLSANSIAKHLVNVRSKEPIKTTQDLKKALKRYTPVQQPSKFLARVFQAIRIEVNDELNCLQSFLQQASQMLTKGGRLVVISYHSMEDRQVKRFLHHGNFTATPTQNVYGQWTAPFQALYKKPVVPSADEIEKNPRARSARLRVGIKN